MLDKLERIKKCLTRTKAELEFYLKDESNDLEERWSTYKFACSIGVIHEILGVYYECRDQRIQEICLYDDLYIDKYQTCYFSDYVERLLEKEIIDAEQADIIKADILQEHPLYAGFENDW